MRVKSPRDPERAARIRRTLLHALSAFVFAAACVVGVYFMRRHVERDLAFPNTPPKVVLKNQPVWMTELLAEQIVRSVRPAGSHSAFDRQLLVDGELLDAFCKPAPSAHPEQVADGWPLDEIALQHGV